MAKIIQKSVADDDSALKKMLSDKSLSQIPKVGDVIKGKIINVSKSEIQVDIEGMTTGVVRGAGLYGESDEYSHLKVGDEVEATVIELENENGEMELSFRFAGHKKVWDKLVELQKQGILTKVTVTDANKGGLMVHLNGIPGFLPVSQLAPEHYPRVAGGEKSKILEKLKKFVGEELEVKVITINENEGNLVVSEKEAWQEKQRDVISSYKVGDIIEGTATAITDFGVFVKFNDLEGLIHISELAWQRIDNPEDIVKQGDIVKAEIISIEGSKIFLSRKKVITDPWADIGKRYQLGQTVKGKIIKINPFGFFVELDQDIHGLAHISELSDKLVKNPNELAKIGDEMEFKIISIEPANHRLGLSLRAMIDPPSLKATEGKESEKADLPAQAGEGVKGQETAEEVKGEKPKKEKKEKKVEPSSVPTEVGTMAGEEEKVEPVSETK